MSGNQKITTYLLEWFSDLMKRLLLKEDERLMQSDSVDIGRGRKQGRQFDALRMVQRKFLFW